MSDSVAARAASLIPLLRERATQHEQACRVSEQTSTLLAQSGVYRMLVPRSVGGLEVHPRQFADTLEALARGDAASAWVAMTGATTGILLAWLDPDVARTMISEAPDAAFAGVFAPFGKARLVDGGYRLTGRWPYASGCENARWRVGGGLVLGPDGPRRTPTGQPEVRSFFFKASQSVVHQTWNVSGLCGSGSHDIAVDDLQIPAHHSVSLGTDAPRHDGTLYQFPVFGLLATGVAAVGLGIARAALDEALALAIQRKTRGGGKSMAESELVQVRLATAEGQLSAARALVHQTLDQVWNHAKQGSIDDADRARIRLAATHAARSSAQVVHAVCDLAGGGGIRSASPFQRHRRDIDVLTTHIMVGEQTLKPVGRILLGLPTDTSGL